MENVSDLPTLYVVNQDKTPIIILVSLSIFFIILFCIFLIYKAFSSRVTNQGSIVETCGPGECATNIYTGEKRCVNTNSDQGTLVQYAVEYEVCNREFLCNNLRTPYALQSDGSIDANGVCQQNTQCRCLQSPQCPNYIATTFNTNNGNPFTALAGQRISFIQNNRYTTVTGDISQEIPLGYSNPSTTFCTVPDQWLPHSVPGCNFTGEMTPDDVTVCMAGGKACLQGVLAYIPSDADNFGSIDRIRTPLGCTTGITCPPGQVNVYSIALGEIVCRTF